MAEQPILDEVPPIEPHEQLIRHIHPEQWNSDEDRPMSSAFAHHELSVDREAMRAAEICCGLRPGWEDDASWSVGSCMAG